MEKYSDDQNVGQEVTVVTGPNAGKTGIVKTSADGVLKIKMPNGVEVAVDEDAVKITGHKGVRGS